LSEESTQLRAALQLLARQGQASPPEPLSGELLVAYYNDQLSEDEKRRVRDHLVACADSRELLCELAVFPQEPEELPAISEARIADAWSHVRSRIASPRPALATVTEFPPRPQQAAPQRPWPWIALAAGLSAACLALSLWIGALRQTVVDLSQPQVNALIEDLYPVDDPLRLDRNAAQRVVEIPRGVTRLVLILHLGDVADSSTRTAQIVAADGHEVWRSAALELSPEGTATLSVPRRFLPAGDYRISIAGVANGDRPALIQYAVSIQYR